MIDVSVIIVTYNSRPLMARCLDAVQAQTSELHLETIVVDNGSSDGTVEHVRSSWPEVTVIESPDNKGFAAGNNLGLAAASGRYFLLLNSDAFLHEGALAALKQFMDDNPDVGMAGPRMLNADGSLQRSARAFPTPWRLATEYGYLRKLAPTSNLLNRFYQGAFSHESVADMDFLMGACLIVRAEAARTVGAMDEGYFMYSEEVDWASRFHTAGWRVTYVPHAEVTHLGGGDGHEVSQAMYNRQATGHLRFLALHRSKKTARRAARVVSTLLWARTVAHRIAGWLIVGEKGRRLAARAKRFGQARRAVRTFAIDEQIPEVPELQLRARASE